MEAGTQQSPLDVSRGTATAAANCSTLQIWAARISFLMVAVAVICLLAWIVMFAE
jgi:hypothetical protein